MRLIADHTVALAMPSKQDTPDAVAPQTGLSRHRGRENNLDVSDKNLYPCRTMSTDTPAQPKQGCHADCSMLTHKATLGVHVARVEHPGGKTGLLSKFVVQEDMTTEIQSKMCSCFILSCCEQVHFSLPRNAFKDMFFIVSQPRYERRRRPNIGPRCASTGIVLRWQVRSPLTVCIFTIVGIASRDASCPRSATRAQLSTTTSTGKVIFMAQRQIRRAVTWCAPRWPSPVRRRAAGHGFLAFAPPLSQCLRSHKPLFWTSSNAQSRPYTGAISSAPSGMEPRDALTKKQRITLSQVACEAVRRAGLVPQRIGT